eukprot:1338132-Prymnesium_polylepis.1
MHRELMRVRPYFAWGHGRTVLDDAHVDAFDVLMLEAYAKTQLCPRAAEIGRGNVSSNLIVHDEMRVHRLSHL